MTLVQDSTEDEMENMETSEGLKNKKQLLDLQTQAEQNSSAKIVQQPVLNVETNAITEDDWTHYEDSPHPENLQTIDTVILIRPTNPDPTAPFKNPGKFALAFQESAFGSVKVREVRTNRRAGIIAVDVQNVSSRTLESLLGVTQIGEYGVECRTPERERFQYGVISPISRETDLATLRDTINQYNNLNILKMERLTSKKQNEIVPSESIRLQFDKSTMPQSIKIGFFHTESDLIFTILYNALNASEWDTYQKAARGDLDA